MRFFLAILSIVTLIVSSLYGCSGGGGGSGNTPPPVVGTVSGLLLVGEGQVLDGDTNDPRDPLIANDNLPGQSVPIPVIIGGYASRFVTTRGKTDAFDIYRINIPGVVNIVLSIAEPDEGDLDLIFADTDGNIIKQSLGTGFFEIIETDPGQTGEFIVAVNAFSGESSYTLSIGVLPEALAALSDMTTNPGYIASGAEFVPNEAVVKMKNGESTAETRSAISSISVNLGLRTKAVSPLGAVLMELENAEDSASALERRNVEDALPLRYKSREDEDKARTIRMIKELRQNPEVEYAEPNYLRKITATPNDDFFNFQWHYPIINLPQAWDITTGSDDVIIAVLDTGVVTNHPDLNGRLLRTNGGAVIGFDFISDPESARDGDGIDADPFDEGDLNNGTSSSFHGTHVSGTVGAATNNDTGVAGVTWGGKIMPVRVLGVGGGTEFDIVQGILFAAGLPNVSGTVPPVRADIINLSLGGEGFSQMEQDAVTQARNAGVVIIAAAGNSNSSAFFSPAGLEGVISTSAVDINKQKARYSNFGSRIDVAAPGGDLTVDRDGDGFADGVLSTLADDSGFSIKSNFAFYQGTSMASPHVAGVVALMLSVNPTLTPNDIDLLLSGTHPDPNAAPITQDLGNAGRDDVFGHGLIDAFLAVNVARQVAGGGGGNPPPMIPVLVVSPGSLSFGRTTSSLQVTISNAGTAPLEVTNIEDDAPWLSVNASNPSVLIVTVNRMGLSDGIFSGNIFIASNGGDKTIPVLMQVQSDSVGGDIGTVFVLVVNPETSNTIEQAVTNASMGYAYTTPQVAAGNYFIVAGTDRDNDGLICDNGEACGTFPISDSPSLVNVDGSEINTDFPVSYNFFASTPGVLGLGGVSFDEFDGFRRLDY